MKVNWKQLKKREAHSFGNRVRITIFVAVWLLCAMNMAFSPASCMALAAGVSMSSLAATESYFPLEPLCFAGNPTHQYFDERLAVQIEAKYTTRLAYFVCDIQAADSMALHTALSQDQVNGACESTSRLASRHNAVLAINGDDYGVHNYGIIIRDGSLIRAKNTTRHLLAMDSQGDLTVIADRKGDTPQKMAERLLSLGVSQTWEFGPELVRDGQEVSLQTKFDLISIRDSTLEPRTAIGQIGPLHYVVIVVDGRRSGYSDGISLAGLQQLFLEAGAKTAFNLDGGGSTTLYFDGEVINRPSGGKERAVSDILYFQ